MPHNSEYRGFNASLIRTIERMRPRRTAFGWLRSLLYREDGASAVEFALLAPLAGAILLFTGAMALQTKNHILSQQILRVGIAAAENDPGMDAVMQRMADVATEKGFRLSPQPTRGSMTIGVVRTCSCPEYPNANYDCRVVCPGQRPSVAFYEMTTLYFDPLIWRFREPAENFLRRQLPAIGTTLLRSKVVIR